MKPSYFVGIVIIILIAVAILYNSDETEQQVNNNEPYFTTGEEVTISGTIQDRTTGCYVDGLCSLIIKSGEETIEIGYVDGRTHCNVQAAESAEELEVGDKIEVFAIVEGGNYLSTCDSESYYIKKIK